MGSAGLRWNATTILDHEEATDPTDRKDQTLMATVATLLRIGPADHGRTMTLEEFLEAEVEEGHRYELARRVLEVTQVPNDPHGVVVCNLDRATSRYDEQHPGVIYRFGGGRSRRAVGAHRPR
jgi:hypothetical protein